MHTPGLCGCHIGPKSGTVAVIYCQLHEAAPDLLAFLVDTIDRRIVEPDSFWGREARALIAKATGKEKP